MKSIFIVLFAAFIGLTLCHEQNWDHIDDAVPAAADDSDFVGFEDAAGHAASATANKYREAKETVGEYAEAAGEKLSDAAHAARDAAGKVINNAGEKLRETRNTVSELADDAAQKMHETGKILKDAAEEYADSESAQNALHRAQEAAEHITEEAHEKIDTVKKIVRDEH